MYLQAPICKFTNKSFSKNSRFAWGTQREEKGTGERVHLAMKTMKAGMRDDSFTFIWNLSPCSLEADETVRQSDTWTNKSAELGKPPPCDQDSEEGDSNLPLTRLDRASQAKGQVGRRAAMAPRLPTA